MDVTFNLQKPGPPVAPKPKFAANILPLRQVPVRKRPESPLVANIVAAVNAAAAAAAAAGNGNTVKSEGADVAAKPCRKPAPFFRTRTESPKAVTSMLDASWASASSDSEEGSPAPMSSAAHAKLVLDGNGRRHFRLSRYSYAVVVVSIWKKGMVVLPPPIAHISAFFVVSFSARNVLERGGEEGPSGLAQPRARKFSSDSTTRLMGFDTAV